MKTFKNQQAARSNFTRAENAYNAARNARCDAQQAFRERDRMEEGGFPTCEAYEAAKLEIKALEAAEQKAEEYAQAVYDAARKQGFYVKSYQFSRDNVTRDLIAMNMD